MAISADHAIPTHRHSAPTHPTWLARRAALVQIQTVHHPKRMIHRRADAAGIRRNREDANRQSRLFHFTPSAIAASSMSFLRT